MKIGSHISSRAWFRSFLIHLLVKVYLAVVAMLACCVKQNKELIMSRTVLCYFIKLEHKRISIQYIFPAFFKYWGGVKLNNHVNN